MKTITEETKRELKEMIYEYFADECDVDVETLNDETNIIEDLDGDSLLFIEIIEIAKKKYDLDIKLQTVGKYMLKNKVETLGQFVEVFYLIYQHGDEIVNIGASA